jgi:two-component system chemotaxis response regulator CheB
MSAKQATYEAVVIGASAGGMKALKTLLSALAAGFPLPIVIVQHMASTPDSYMAEYLGNNCNLPVKEADDKEAMKTGTVYLAPPDYHLQIEPDRTLSLSVDPPVNYSCPSIDVLFESAARCLGNRVIGVILTGASADGAAGLKKIRQGGGLAIVQNPAEAEAPFMPQSAIAMAAPGHILMLEEISPLLEKMAGLNPQKA